MIIATCQLLKLHIIEVAMASRPGQPLPLLLRLHPSPHQEVIAAAAAGAAASASRLLLRKKENLFFPKVKVLLGIEYEVAATTQVSTKENLKGIKDLSFTPAATAIQLACIKLHRKT